MSVVRALALVVVVLSAGAVRAGPWHARAAVAMGVAATDEISAVGLTVLEGDGFLVGSSLGQMHIHPLAHTLVAGPTVDSFLVASPSFSVRPTMAFSAGYFLITGDGALVTRVRVGSTAVSQFSGTANSPDLLGIAADPTISGRVLATWSVASFENLTLSNNAFASAAAPADYQGLGSFSPLSPALASRAGTAVVIGDDTGAAIWLTTDVTTPTNWVQTAVVPAEVDASAVVAVNDAGLYLIASRASTLVVVDDLTALTDPQDCVSATTADFTAVAAFGTDFVLADANGFFHRLAIDGSCIQAWQASLDTGVGGPIHAISMRSPREILVVGEDGAGAPRVAWRNRPPLVPTITGGGAVDDDDVVVASATSDDPDANAGVADPQSFTWTCDAGLVVTGTDTDTITVTTPHLCVDAAVPGARTDFVCTVVTADDEGLASPPAATTFSVLPVDVDAPTGVGVSGLVDGAVVLTGTALSLSATASDDCLYQASWVVRDEVGGLVQEQAGPASWNSPFTFTATTLGTDQLTWYTLELSVTDTAGNTGTLPPFRFGVGVPQPPVAVDLSCPTDLEAGMLGAAVATPRRDSGVVLDYRWQLGGAAVIADATPTDATFSFQTDACDGGDRAVVRMVPRGLFEDGAQQVCTIELLDPADPAPPALSLAEAPEQAVVLGERAAEVALHPAVVACASHAVRVDWDVSALPAALRPVAADASGVLALARDQALVLSVPPELLATLQGMALPVRAAAVDERTGLASGTAEVLLRFAVDPELAAVAGVDVRLGVTATGPVDDGELVAVAGTIGTDVAVALPALTVAIVGSGLVPVPGSVVTASSCGARAVVTEQSDDLVFTLDGLTSSCPLELRLLARRGFGGGGLAAQGCTWGAERVPLSRCDGGLALEAPPALSCGAGGVPSALLLGLAVLAGVRLRPSRSRRR